MQVFFGRPWESTVRLMADTGYGVSPLLGVTYDQVDVQAKKPGLGFSPVTLTEDMWVERDRGFYSLLWQPTYTDILGEVVFTIDFPYQESEYVGSFQVVPEPFYIDSSTPHCILTGNIVDLGSEPMGGVMVSVRLLSVPTASGPSLVAGGSLRTYTDAFGNFSIKLVRETRVIVEIETSGIKNTITIPDQPTASLIDLLPPIP